MAWSYTQQWQQAVKQENINLVQVAIVQAAIAISAESDQTANHTNRVALARQVLADPSGWSERFVWGIVTDATVQSAPTDANIYNAVAGQWNAYAGVT